MAIIFSLLNEHFRALPRVLRSAVRLSVFTQHVLLESYVTSIKYPLLRAFEVILKNSLLSNSWLAGLLKESYCACHGCCLHYVMDVKTGYIVIANAQGCDDVVGHDCKATAGAISVHITHKAEQGAVLI